jgi:ribosomal protein L32
MANFHVLFSGDIAPGASREHVMRGLQRTLGIDERKVSQLFAGRTVVLKSQLDAAEAQSLVAVLAAIGAVCRVKDYAPQPAGNPARFKLDEGGVDRTLRDLTAAHVECPRCGHMQLIAEFCQRCGVDINAAQKRVRKEDALIEKKLKALRTGKRVAEPPAAEEKAAKTGAAHKMVAWFRKVQ